MVALGVLAWAGGYVVYFFSPETAQQIWGPMVWLVRNPPDPTLATLIGIVVMTALFFEPMYEFLSDLDEAFGWKRRREGSPQSDEKTGTPLPPPQGP